MFTNALFYIPPEIAHKMAIFALKNNFIPIKKVDLPRSLNISLFNKSLKTPIGVAAGFDKNAEVIRPLLSTGFSFVEVGTVTRYPQKGNKKPRVFRLVKEEAIINSLGFNNKGIDFVIKKVNDAKLNHCIFGINIGYNKTSHNPVQDYFELVKKIYGLSNYITLNISSPNTPGLRNFQKQELLSELLTAISQVRKLTDYAESVPIMLKISPDISDNEKQDIVDLSLKYKVSGLIISNTSSEYHKLLESSYTNIQGGLSGKPIFDLSTKVLSEVYKITQQKLLLIGCGGVSSGYHAYEKIKAGASLIQLYTAIVYHGFNIANKISLELAELLSADGFPTVSHAIGHNN
ncbi:dihydroorotate dehydrogenase 2 [Ehrlichia ruminantium]|uniref:Dihydroorotate dehydrogenase (quinone) n=1 Tax=Ehrlichia ruminantium TaxID=779 RepID=A0A161LY40_EHRRU|nr:quinone-dependent dihydroorotate dehydrogenase [Ehrlichia ruminantium]QLK52105.1 quinone-dependent dihydroorotate dehydrogenase [Ehrlichia ruminantium]QLK53937.1 quinone-dependent dihydroorotate dehydrogenase [Ehrlichia ruminantium]QLK56687.1 quinone-dependent dihydroorotate dehydrogenase [Ehrlichia ruminantium]QLK57599.1 quinone-dependent dihydroorotate dehydrogenase [Ehrlichia ruminantium]UOD98061.1 quinone-dependent dihydroorotate dehydrogenase [Ehrlichia ruminantium]